jgi:hypothetical protein
VAERGPRGTARGEHEAVRLHTSRPPHQSDPPGE